jgi:hypothetical protein
MAAEGGGGSKRDWKQAAKNRREREVRSKQRKFAIERDREASYLERERQGDACTAAEVACTSGRGRDTVASVGNR